MTNPPADDRKAWAEAELLDLGVGTGARLYREAERLGVTRPVGIERNRTKVAQARAAGLPVFEGDLLGVDPADFPAVKIVVLDNVLEHLSSLSDVERAIALACSIASHVVYVRHPSFEDVAYLDSLGLKQYWTDWPGVHAAPVRLAEFLDIALRNRVRGIEIRPLKCAYSSDDPTILPATSPPHAHKSAGRRNEHGVYDEARHGPKRYTRFDRPVHYAFDLFFVGAEEPPQICYRADTELAAARPQFPWSRTSEDLARRIVRRAKHLLSIYR